MRDSKIPAHSDICNNIPVSVTNSYNLTRFESFWFVATLQIFSSYAVDSVKQICIIDDELSEIENYYLYKL